MFRGHRPPRCRIHRQFIQDSSCVHSRVPCSGLFTMNIPAPSIINLTEGRPHLWIGWLGIIAWMLMIEWAGNHLPDTLHYSLFCEPAARFAGYFFGIPAREITLSGSPIWLIPHPALEIHVVRDCSGFRFFLLLYSLAIWNLLRHRFCALHHLLLCLPALLPAIYGVTLLTNTIRIISVVEVRFLSNLLLPERLQAAAHVLTGSLIFLTTLILTQWTYERFIHTPAHR